MRYRHENGLDISDSEPFRLNDIKYPANWIQFASDEEIAAIGLVAYEPTPEPEATPDPAPPEPDSLTGPLTRRELREALLTLGKTAADVDAAIDSISDPVARESARIAWEDAGRYEYSAPLVTQLIAAMGLDVAETEAAWRYAVENR